MVLGKHKWNCEENYISNIKRRLGVDWNKESNKGPDMMVM
jgi:hypothetical protein